MHTVTSLRRVVYEPGAYIALALTAILLGLGLAQWGPVVAAALLGLTAGIVAISHGRGLLVVMTACIFVAALSVGGAAGVGRLVGGLALLVAVLVVTARGWDGLVLNSLVLAVGVMGSWLLISVEWAANDAYVYRTLLSFALGCGYMVAFALLVRRHRDIVAVFAVFAGGLIIFGVAAAIGAVRASGAYRAEGLLGDPNYFALYQLVAFAPALAFLTYLPRQYRLLGCVVLPAAAIVSVGASLSRAAFIVLVLLLASLPLLPRPNFFPTQSERSIYIFSILGASTITVYFLYDKIVGRAQSILEATSPEGDKGSGRLDIWAAAWHGYQENPLLGLGAGNFRARSFELLQTTPGVTVEASYVRPDTGLHNSYLEMLTEGGIPGLASYLVLLVLIATYLVHTRRRAIEAADLQLARVALALLVSLGTLAAFSCFVGTQLNKVTWILVGFALALDVMSRRLPRRRAVYLRWHNTS
jgi:O-antigen ligase